MSTKNFRLHGWHAQHGVVIKGSQRWPIPLCGHASEGHVTWEPAEILCTKSPLNLPSAARPKSMGAYSSRCICSLGLLKFRSPSDRDYDSSPTLAVSQSPWILPRDTASQQSCLDAELRVADGPAAAELTVPVVLSWSGYAGAWPVSLVLDVAIESYLTNTRLSSTVPCIPSRMPR